MREEVAAHYRQKGYTIRERVQVRGRSGSIHAVDMVAQGPLGNLVIAFEDAGGLEGPEVHAVRRTARDIGATGVVAARRIPEGVRRQAAQAGIVLLDEEALHARPAREPPQAAEPIAYPPWPDPFRTRDEDAPAEWPATARGRPVASGPMEPTDIDDVVSAWGAQTGRPRKTTDPGFWKYPRGDEPLVATPPAMSTPRPPRAQFEWLPRDEPVPAPAATPVRARTQQARGRATNDRPRVEAAPRPAAGPASATAVRRQRAARSDRLLNWAAAGAGFGASAAVVLYALMRLAG